MASFAVKFLGCKVSQADAMLARRALLAAGHTEAPPDGADLHVINTCAITGEAEAKSRQAVRRSLRSAAHVYVSGCAVNLEPRRFGDLDPRVTAFAGTAEPVAVGMAAAATTGLATTGQAATGQATTGQAATGQATTGQAIAGEDVTACADVEHDVLARARLAGAAEPLTRTRGFVKVQDGCDCHCAYCIIPTVRGGARSRPAGAVLREVAERVRAGQPEMVMTGISVGDYRDPEHGLELGELMVEVASVPGVQRVRLSSVEVIHLKDSLLHALVSEPKVCPHLHVPMQSGDDAVLRGMGRHYTVAEYLDRVAAVRAAAPAVNVTTDVIVGFPTEDEPAFERTLRAVDAAQITRVHVFPYSPRPGTAADRLGDQVTPPEKKRRSEILRGRSEVRSRQHRMRKLGRDELVLIDKVAEHQCSGYTADYTRCYLPVGTGARGELVPVTCEELQADGIRARMVDPA